MNPVVPYNITHAPTLQPLLSMLQYADHYFITSARSYAISTVVDHPNFLFLSSGEQIPIALLAGVAKWLEVPFLTLV